MESFKTFTNQSDQTVTNQSDIFHVQKTYFVNLYKKKISTEKMNEKINGYMSKRSVPRLSEEQKQSCEGILKEVEVLEALKQTKNGLAPGIDASTIDIFKTILESHRKAHSWLRST